MPVITDPAAAVDAVIDVLERPRPPRLAQLQRRLADLNVDIDHAETHLRTLKAEREQLEADIDAALPRLHLAGVQP